MFGDAVESAARADALARFPHESCGIVVAGEYLPIENVASDPGNHFEMPPATWRDHPRIEAVIHSHGPQHLLAPSADDMRHQIATAVPWGITRCDGVVASSILWWGDFRLDDPLVGREFVHGVTDCYAIIRSWYWQNRQIKLPEFPRDNAWWSQGGDLYNDGFAIAGFRVVPAADAAPGDVPLINFRSKVPNHAGVLIEGGLLLHHLMGRKSVREPVGRWTPMISKWLRYEG